MLGLVVKAEGLHCPHRSFRLVIPGNRQSEGTGEKSNETTWPHTQ
jgi:hypothetical protein